MNAQVRKSNGQLVVYQTKLIPINGKLAWRYKRGNGSVWKSPADPYGSFNKLRGFLMFNE
jgi:phosphoribosylformylglycinamidine (FGAM) synthase-like amidotransferase family enzyme